MNREYYDQYYELERTHWWFKVRAKIIINHCAYLLNKNQTTRVLNVGAGTGFISQKLEAIGEIESIEYDQELIDQTLKRTTLQIKQGSILDLPYADESFDLVCAFDVIEHVADDAKAIEEMKRVCKKNGHIFITVPAFQFLWSKHDEVNHHFRRYTKKSLLSVMLHPPIVFISYFNTLLFIPILILRMVNNLKQNIKLKNKDSQSDFSEISSPGINRVFEFIFNLETRLLKNRIAFPFGVSLLCSFSNRSAQQ